MIKKIVIIVIAVFLFEMGYSQNRTEELAKKEAKEWMQYVKKSNKLTIKNVATRNGKNGPVFHSVNFTEGGFVVLPVDATELPNK